VARRLHAVRQPLELGVPTREQTTIDRRWNISFNSQRVTAFGGVSLITAAKCSMEDDCTLGDRYDGRARLSALPRVAAIFEERLFVDAGRDAGGTVLHKGHLAPASDISEDIDLVLVGDPSLVPHKKRR